MRARGFTKLAAAGAAGDLGFDIPSLAAYLKASHQQWCHLLARESIS